MYSVGEKYWFFEGGGNFKGKILVGKLVGINNHDYAKLEVGKDHYFNLKKEFIFCDSDSLLEKRGKLYENKYAREVA